MKKKIPAILIVSGLMTVGALVGCEKPATPSVSTPTPTTSVAPTTSVPAGESQTSVGPVTPSSTPAPTTSTPASGSSSSGGGAASSSSSTPSTQFSFSVALQSGAVSLNKGDTDVIEITETNNDGTARQYSYSSANTAVATVSDAGVVTAVAKGSVRIEVREQASRIRRYLDLTVTEAVLASGGYNYASLTGAEAVTKRTEILGQLEKYAMDNHLTGITLFENGGYVKYSDRVTLPTTNYITGYGFGLLSEGSIDKDLDSEQNPNYKRYLHTGTASDPKKINARNDTTSEVSDLEGYITSSFWGTKLNSTKDQYVWYPVLAKNKVTYNGISQDFNRPIAVFNGQEVKPGENPNPLGLYKTWRIYVKTGADGVKFRYNGTSWGKDFDSTNVTINDYEFAYRLLLTGSHGLVRGTEMAADQTYGIKGALQYNTRSKELSDEAAKSLWETMKGNGKLGIKTGHDSTNGDYIELTLLNAIDSFTAMYTLSSSLLSPMSEDFIRTIGEGSLVDGAQRYGLTNNNSAVPAAHKDKIVDYVLSVGPYMLEDWQKNQTIIFKRNDTWNEPGRYKIPGVKMIVFPAATEDPTAIYKQFNAGLLDSCGIPKDFLKDEVGKARVYKTKGDSTFKLNVNSCTQEMWDELFGPNGKINKNSNWDVKPWMSNDNFLNGLFYSIDRKTFAGNRGVNPSINYFADSYLNDPQNGKSYNDSDAHKAAVRAYEVKDSGGNSLYGYSKDKAILCFSNAVKELVKEGKLFKGTKSKPTIIKIHIKWMYTSNIKEYGDEIGEYFESAFNDDRVCNGTVKLEVEQDAVTNWSDVYNEYLMKGQFDLGFGAISGNTYNPLNFLEVLKSDNSSGFTLNWGSDTSKVNTKKPLVYDNKIWSFDALWAVADHGGVVEDGRNIKPVKKSFMTYTQNDFNNGTTFYVKTNFFQDPNDTVKFEVTRISIYVMGSGNYDLEFTIDPEKGYKIVLSKEKANEIRDEIIRVFKLMDEDTPVDKRDDKPFTVDHYIAPGVPKPYWSIEVYYNLSIKDSYTGEWGTPSENYTNTAKNEDAWIDN